MSIVAWMILAVIPGFFGGALAALRKTAVRVGIKNSE